MAPQSPFRNNIVAGKVALVTGGGSGIGFEISRQLGLHGARLVIMGRREAVIKAASIALQSEGITVEPIQGDVRNSLDAARAVDLALEKFGQLDILVNSAAGNFLSPAESLTPKGFKTVLDIDTLGTFTMCHAAFNALKAIKEKGDSNGGLIINISATLQYGATWYQSHASAAKAAIDSLTRSLALEWGRDYSIRVNAIAPGPIANTAGLFKLDPAAFPNAIKLPEASEIVPLGRLGEAWDIAMAVLYLSSSAGNWVSGEIIVVDGASWLYKPQYVDREFVKMASRSVEKKSREIGVSKL